MDSEHIIKEKMLYTFIAYIKRHRSSILHLIQIECSHRGLCLIQQITPCAALLTQNLLTETELKLIQLPIKQIKINLKRNEAKSARAESTHKGGN